MWLVEGSETQSQANESSFVCHLKAHITRSGRSVWSWTGEVQPIDVSMQILPVHCFFMYLNTNITSNNFMLNISSPKLVDIKHKFKMACFNFEHIK